MRQRNWRELAVRLVGNDRQRLLSDSLYPIIARFSRLCYYTERISLLSEHLYSAMI